MRLGPSVSSRWVLYRLRSAWKWESGTEPFATLTDEDNLASHNTIVSQGGLARNHTDGDLTSRQRLRASVELSSNGAYSIIRLQAIDAKLAFKSNEVAREATPFPQQELP